MDCQSTKDLIESSSSAKIVQCNPIINKLTDADHFTHHLQLSAVHKRKPYTNPSTLAATQRGLHGNGSFPTNANHFLRNFCDRKAAIVTAFG